MSGRKLSRFAGLLMALAIAVGGFSAGAASTESTQAEVRSTQSWHWT